MDISAELLPINPPVPVSIGLLKLPRLPRLRVTNPRHPPAQPLLPIILLPRLPTPASPRSLMSSAKWSMQSRDSVSHTLVVVEQTDEDRVEEA